MTIKLKSILYVGPVKIFRNFDTPVLITSFQLDVNVVSADWKKGATKIYYPTAAATTQTVGAFFAHTMKGLVENFNATYDNMWCVGFSLGSHVCGHAGMETGGQIARITGEYHRLNLKFISF